MKDVAILRHKEAELLIGMPVDFDITFADGASNITNVTIQALDAEGHVIGRPLLLDVYLSKTANGLAITDHVADTITASTGSVWAVKTAAAVLQVRTDANGKAVLVVTDTHKTANYVCVANPVSGKVSSELLATADYGA
jgi:hypothetical protein